MFKIIKKNIPDDDVTIVNEPYDTTIIVMIIIKT